MSPTAPGPGPNHGASYLKTQTLHLERGGRAANTQPRHYKITLPDTTGANCTELARISLERSSSRPR